MDLVFDSNMHTTQPGSRNRFGFTLIEVLVVVGVLGILATLLVPALGRAKRKARDAQCIGNLRQQFLGLQEFVSSQGVYPLSPTIVPRGKYPEHDSGWMYAVQNEIGPVSNAASEWRYSGIWICPSRRQLPVASLGGSYGYNSEGLGLSEDESGLGLGGHYVRRWSGLGNTPVAASEVASPSTMLALGDGVSGAKGGYVDGMDLLWRSQGHRYGDADSNKRVSERHGSRINVAFCDGHVASPRLDSLFSDEGDGALQQWNRDNLPHRERIFE